MKTTKFASAVTVLACSLASASAAAQSAPAFIPIQGSITNDDGTPKSGAHRLRLRLYSQDELPPGWWRSNNAR